MNSIYLKMVFNVHIRHNYVIQKTKTQELWTITQDMQNKCENEYLLY
jgi:hypothetical protein